MQWLNPSGAWALLGAIPIIALYLLRNRSKPARVPSLLLWQRLQASSLAARPFQRLKSRLLLWLRLLLVALMAVVLMRPAAVGMSGGEQVFIFDLSASMQAVSGGKSRIELAREQAERMLSAMREGDNVTVLCAGASVSQPVVRQSDHAAVRAAIGGLRAGNGGADMDGALSLALAMKRDIPSLGITVFTDGYQTANTQVAVESVGEGADNVSLADLRISEDDSGAYAYARVVNYGAAREATLECYSGGALCDARALSLDADGTHAVRFELPIGAQDACVRLTDTDALAADNARYAAVSDTDGESALIVTDGNVFLERALSLREGLKVYKTDDADMNGDYDLYIYDCKLPEALPWAGAVFALAPAGEVMGITPEERVSATAGLRLSSGGVARDIGQNLTLDGVALRGFTPLTGGQAAIECDGQPVLSLAERDGRRAAVLGFDLHDSNLPLKVDFPLLVQNLLGYLLPDISEAVGNVICGEPVSLPINDRAMSAYVLTPAGRSAALSGSTLEDTDEIGIYTLVERFEDGGERASYFTAHMPDAEADTRGVAPSKGAEGGAAQSESAVEWTGWALIAWLLLLMLEWGVSRRGVSR